MRARVAPLHGHEDAIRARLHRQMQAWHQLRQIAVRRDQTFVHVGRMAGRVAQACDALDFGRAAEQTAERPLRAVGPRAMIGVHVLPDERDLTHTGGREAFHLGHDLRDGTRHFGATRIGHHAKRAEPVASFLNRDKRGDAARTRRRAARGLKKIEFILDRKLRVDHAALAGDAVDERGQAMVALRADHEIDRRGAAQDFLALRLRDAAGNRDQHAAVAAAGGFLQFADTAEFRIDLLGRLLANVAGVEDDEVGVFGGRGFDESFRRQNVRHTIGIVDVHLAAVRFDEKLAGSAHAGPADLDRGRSDRGRITGHSGSSDIPCSGGRNRVGAALLAGFPAKWNGSSPAPASIALPPAGISAWPSRRRAGRRKARAGDRPDDNRAAGRSPLAGVRSRPTGTRPRRRCAD